MEVDEPIQITRKNYKDFVYDIERRINEDNMMENESNNEAHMKNKMTSEKQLNHIKKMNEMRKLKKQTKNISTTEVEHENRESFLWNFMQSQGLFLAGILSVSAGVYYITKKKPVKQQQVTKKETPTTTSQEPNYSSLSLDF